MGHGFCTSCGSRILVVCGRAAELSLEFLSLGGAGRVRSGEVVGASNFVQLHPDPSRLFFGSCYALPSNLKETFSLVR